MDSLLTLSSVILDSLSDGVYVCDKNRRIAYWSKSAEGSPVGNRRTWLAAVASTMFFATSTRTVISFVAKSSVHCTGRWSRGPNECGGAPWIVFAKGKNGKRIPCK